ncbi:MAG: adenylate/guanylate cyclase domain-containing protein [Alphaproteobacteria bacterium]
MTSERVERRLTAILAADVAGYSRLMGMDEEGTLAQLKALRRALMDPQIAEHRGRIVKTTGDGMLVEFASVVDALRCAVEVQRGMAERNAELPQDKRIELRVGIHQGDIMIDGNDIFGDGVNVAARLEGLAEPGGICISARVQEDARGKLDIAFEDAGEQQLKNIDRLVRMYRVRCSSAALGNSVPAPTLPDKPSIAVLPFQNMSGDPEQEYFADGMVEDIITALSRFRQLFVIARNSSFTYKGRAVDVKQVGRELGVRYVLEGSVRKSGNRVRITGQLIDAMTSAHLWADRFDGTLEDVFDLQDQVSVSVVSAIAPKMEQVEIERAKHKPTESLDAYDYFLRGTASLHQGTKVGIIEALRLFYRATELDPNFASAYGLAAWCYVVRKTNGWMSDLVEDVAEATRLARRATELGRDDAVALCWGGYALAYVAGDVDAALAFIDQALTLNPNLAAAWNYSGWVRTFIGEHVSAIERFERSLRLSPRDPTAFHMRTGIAYAYFFTGQYDKAASLARDALRDQPHQATFLGGLRILAASKALAGQLEEAQEAIDRLLQLDPAVRVSNLKDRISPLRPEDFAKYVDGLRKAGLPE